MRRNEKRTKRLVMVMIVVPAIAIAAGSLAGADPIPTPSVPTLSGPSASPSPTTSSRSAEPSPSSTVAQSSPVPSVTPSAPSIPALPQLPSPLSYKVHSIYTAPDGATVEKFSDAVLFVPIPVDVDGTAASNATPDILVQLTIDAGRATVRVNTLPGAANPLPLLLEAIVSDPRGSTNLKVAYGYDALGATAPTAFQSTVQLAGAARVSSFALDVETVGAGSKLAVIGEVYEEGAGGTRLDPQRGRIEYSPVPAAAHFGLVQGSDLGIQQSGVDLTTSTPTRVAVVIEDIQGDRSLRGDLLIDTLPNLVSLILTDSSDGRRTWSYQASDVVETLSFTLRDSRPGATFDEFAIILEDMATNVVLVQDTPTHATFQANAPIGAVSAGSATDRPIAWLNEPAYIYSTDRGAGDSFAFRILGLSRAEFDTGDPFLVDVDIKPGPFHVLIEDGARTLDGRINDLPGHVRVQFSTVAGTLEYTGSAPIGEIRVDVTDPAGVSGRATALHLRLADVPTQLSLAFGTSGGDAKLDAHDGAIGSVDLLLTSGPSLSVDPGFDGVVLQDVPSHYALAARLTGLKLVSVSTDAPPYALKLVKNAGPFLVDLKQGSRAIRLEIHDLPSSLDATFDPDGLISYQASAPIALITAVASDPAGLAGRATDLTLKMADVPAALTLDFSTADAATLNAHGARIGSIDLLLTSGPQIAVDNGYDGVVLEDVPSHYAFVVRLTGLRLAKVSTGSPYTIDLRKDAGKFLARMSQGQRFTEVRVHDLPDSLHATLDPAGSLAYTASAPIGELLVNLRDPEGVSGRATRLDLTVRGLPQQLTLDLPASGRTVLDAHGSEIGLIDLMMTSGAPLGVPAGYDGVVLRDTDELYALAARLEGLRYASVSTTAPYAIDLRKKAGPFLVDLLQGARTTFVEVRDLPSELAVTLDPDGSASYVASAPIGHITVRLFDPAGVAGRATLMRLDLDALPASLDLTFGSSTTASIDAHGASIGLVDLLLTSGPDATLPTGFDGVILRDVTDHYVFAVRLQGLRLVSLSSTAPYALDLRKTASPFLIDLTQQTRTTRVEIHDLPDSLQAALDTATGSLRYTASAPIGSLRADIADPAGVSGRATSLRLNIDALPAALDLTYGSGATASIDAHGASIGLIDLMLTSGPEISVPAGFDGVVLQDVVDHYAFAVRLTGLRLVSLSTTAPYTLDLRKATGPLLIDLTQASRTTRVEVRDLPSSFQATLDPVAGSLAYTASAAISSVRADIADPAGVSGRATEMHLAIDGLPQSLDLSFGSGTVASIDAHGGTIGLIDLLLTSGPDVVVPSGYDGFVLQDLPTHYALAAHITGLRAASVTTTAPYRLTIDKAAGPFVVHLMQNLRETLVDVRDLPASVNAVLDPNGTLSYTGSARIASLDAEISDPSGVAGRATLLRLALTDIPTSLSLDFGTSSAAGIDAHGSRLGSASLLATSGPEIAVDDGYDGVVLEDIASHFALAARLNGLAVARVTTGAAPYTLTLEKTPGPFVVRMTQGARTTLVKVHDLPSALTATLDPAGSLTYSASAPVGEISAQIADPAGVAGRATQASALLRGIPTALDLSWAGTGGAVTADAKSATVGLLEVALTSGPDVTLPADRDGLLLEDVPDHYALFGRITGLRKVSFTQGPPPSFDLQTTGGRLFQVSLTTASGAVTTALIDRLPSQVSIAFTSATAMAYRASATVTAVTLDAYDPRGISGRANTLHGVLRSLPTALDASWASSGTITLDAKGGTMGLIELQLTSGPDDRLAPQYDGILLEDIADRYVVFARITGLKKLIGTQVPQPDFTLTTTGGRVLKIDLTQLNGGKVQYTRGTLDALPETIRVRISDKEMFYDASSPATSLLLDTNSSDRWNLHVDIRNPLPAHMYFCAASDGFCNGYRRSSGAGSFAFDASEHTSVNLFDCVRPLNSNCVRGEADEFTQVDNWRVRHFEFDAESSDTAFDGYTFNNSNGHTLQGYLLRIGGSVGFEADIHPGYWSSNRHVEWSWWGADKDKSGSVNCAGSGFSVRVFGIWIGVTGYVC